MITNQHLQGLEPGQEESAKAALAQLYRTGLLLFAIHEVSTRLAGGFGGVESAEDLAKRIIEHRIASGALRGLHELGKQFNKE